jgi:Flp pilus assembly protein TadB
MKQQSGTGSKWPLERALFLMAGTMTILSAVLAAVLSPWFLLLTGFVGLNQLVYVLVGACPASLILGRTCGLNSSYVENTNMEGAG